MDRASDTPVDIKESSDPQYKTEPTVSAESLRSPPVTLRWDSASSIEKLTFPENEPNTLIARLLKDADHASFGFQGKDVIDETYRKALKLDTSKFSTNFCPYEVGIVDIIGQALLPQHPIASQGVRAELYKLNIYQAPSAFFKPHVDTPRSDLQFGSLVVYLPCAHEGGQLVVRHRGQAITFNWSNNSKAIQWAAFYSDCEHEVLEVVSGHRITLTYNLYARRGLGEVADLNLGLSLQQLPLYIETKAALENPRFMTNGGVLGKYCSHAYAHTTREGISALPRVLKGHDMIALTIFRALGLAAAVSPVLDTSKNEDELDKECLAQSHVGETLSVPHRSDVWEEEPLSEVFDAYPHIPTDVSWLNGPVHGTENLQFGYLRYGNQAELDFAYSFCALLFEIPAYHKRIGVTASCN
ncbi:hypothetical protein T440DRAFT_520817 [Plenodomus tracheiphilus IPT5]|uniref:Fe2OG dioxygenase domain-containing protein n=1 Tax=Plenodomus tracheiphilus IPT5 TaxID=1408161 RepID=A0A6A7AZ60_9PLEO|nr:hypothetical protein T440DRAFT_520817 [Plenodomus tracheiphilus IPT5]